MIIVTGASAAGVGLWVGIGVAVGSGVCVGDAVAVGDVIAVGDAVGEVKVTVGNSVGNSAGVDVGCGQCWSRIEVGCASGCRLNHLICAQRA